MLSLRIQTACGNFGHNSSHELYEKVVCTLINVAGGRSGKSEQNFVCFAPRISVNLNKDQVWLSKRSYIVVKSTLKYLC